MLPESRLYSFIDQNEGFALHFFEGQKLIQELAVIHTLVGGGFQYFRDAILTFQTMVSFLKPGEGLGVYLDSDSPYLRLKIEMSDQGQMRTLLFPEDLKSFPDSITGKCRITKLHPGDKSPYTSIINLNKVDSHQVANVILEESYQVKSKIYVSEKSDQSVMILKLPEVNVNKVQTYYPLSLAQYWDKISNELEELFALGTTDYTLIQTRLERAGLLYLGSKEIKFKCNCSRQRMLDGVRAITMTSGINHVFAPDEKEIEAKCDYCKTAYLLLRSEF